MIDVRRLPHHPAHPAHDCADCACGVEPLAHPRYSFGMLLEARHLALEHRYAAMRLNTHDIRLHDFGTVCGLRVDKHPSPDCVNQYAILRPGIALDCCGREIVVPEELFVPLYDGARSGWCGAPVAAAALPALPAGMPPKPRTTLYIYVRFAQCDTDPIPTYVKSCGCCGPCEHGEACVPSVTREGYEVWVSTVAPAVWRNPVGAAFCDWLDAKLKGPGSTPRGLQLIDQTLDHALCAIVTEPCADFCSNGNDALLLATLTFDANDALQTIDNCTNRRLVISTGAIVEAIECLTTAVVNCCKPTAAFIALAGTVVPNAVNLEALPPGNQLTYTVTATNADATLNASAFTLELKFPGGLSFVSAELAVDGQAQPAPSGDATGVKANVALLGAGRSTVLTVKATFDPQQRHAGDVLTATADVASYTGPSAPPVQLPVTFTDVRVDGPRIVFKDFPQSLTPEGLANILRAGWQVPFTEPIDTSTAIPDPNPATGTVFLEVLSNGAPAPLPVAIAWSNGNQLLTVRYASTATTFDPIAVLVQNIEADFARKHALRLVLKGGGPVKGSIAVGPTIRGATGQRIDGDPPQGGPPEQHPGESGNGTQGGDFVWEIPIVNLADGPHVDVRRSKLPVELSFPAAITTLVESGLTIVFDEPMNTAEPPSGIANPASVKLTFGGTALPITPTWTDDRTLRIVAPATIRRQLGRGGVVGLTLVGGPKGGGPSPVPALTSTDGRRLDGEPNGRTSSTGLSGDGRQGGDFVWPIIIKAG